MNSIEQVNVTNNQSTLNYSFKHITLGNNAFEEAIFSNNSGADFDLVTGVLVVRDVATPTQVNPATAANLADVIGIAYVDSSVTLADTETAAINYIAQGGIAEECIVLPDTVTDLDFIVGTGTLKDKLNSLGFHLQGSVDNTKLDNQ